MVWIMPLITFGMMKIKLAFQAENAFQTKKSSLSSLSVDLCDFSVELCVIIKY